MIKKIMLSITITTPLFASNNHSPKVMVKKKDGTEFSINKDSCKQDALSIFKLFSSRCASNFDPRLNVILFLGHSEKDIASQSSQDITKNHFNCNFIQYPKKGYVYFIAEEYIFSRECNIIKKYHLIKFSPLRDDWEHSLLYKLLQLQKTTAKKAEDIFSIDMPSFSKNSTNIMGLTGIPYKCIQYSLTNNPLLSKKLQELFNF
jgi:hypothetical protein